MKIVFLESSAPSVAWMRAYYSRVFPAGKKNATKQYQKSKKLIKENPEIGHEFHGVLRYVIPKTPFSIIYQIEEDEIQILRIWDERRAAEQHLF